MTHFFLHILVRYQNPLNWPSTLGVGCRSEAEVGWTPLFDGLVSPNMACRDRVKFFYRVVVLKASGRSVTSSSGPGNEGCETAKDEVEGQRQQLSARCMERHREDHNRDEPARGQRRQDGSDPGGGR